MAKKQHRLWKHKCSGANAVVKKPVKKKLAAAKRQTRVDRWLEQSGCDIKRESFVRMGPAGRDSWEDAAIVGISLEEPARLVYSYEELVESLADDLAKCESEFRSRGELLEEAEDFVDFNTIRALPYMSVEMGGESLPPPLIIRSINKS